MNSQHGTLKEYYIADLALHSYYEPSQINVPNPLMAQFPLTKLNDMKGVMDYSLLILETILKFC